ncbi:MAG TPA: hypothetical protein GXX53_02785 [Tissierellia bacterium]|nr:hypothetical protein [Tissierellia bacterium]
MEGDYIHNLNDILKQEIQRENQLLKVIPTNGFVSYEIDVHAENGAYKAIKHTLSMISK